MNNKLPLIAVIIIGLLVAGYFLMKRSDTSMAPEDEVIVSSGDGEEVVAGKMADLLKMGKNYSCTYASGVEGDTSSGTVYVANKGTMFRGEFMTVDEQNPEGMLSHVIRSGDTMYFWTDGDEPGFMYTYDFDQAEGEDAANQNDPLQSDDEYEFECRTWSPDNAMFVPPTDKEFTDMSAQMEMMKAQSESMTEDDSAPKMDCSVCNNIPAGEDKDQCLQALGC